MLGRSGLRGAGAALLVFTALLFAAPAPSAASSYTMAYTGTVTSTSGAVFQALGVVAGDSVSGTLTIDPLNEGPGTVLGPLAFFSQTSAAFTFHVSHPANLTFSDSGGGAVLTNALPLNGAIAFSLTGADSGLLLDFQSVSARGPLLSLSGLPNSPSALVAWLGSGPFSASGSFNLTGLGSVGFDIALTSTTPIPPALPLFVSALGGLGFMTWRRRAAKRPGDDTGALSA
jgi:hypothetical protein